MSTGFRLPRLCLPGPGIDLARWAVIACDQYTAQPEYWQRVAELVGDAPSTLHLTFPEVYLDRPDATARIARIHAAMHRYLADGLLVARDGAVYVERSVHGRTRHGLMLELDLEHYDFSPGSSSLTRPTEGTIVSRLAPRIAVRRDAELELPHILVLIDDPAGTVIEPIAAQRARLAPLYATELMFGGGHVAGYAVDATRGERAARALQMLASPSHFARRYGMPEDAPPMLFAVGDGNHSLATAKAIWDRAKATVDMHHPSRYALVEVENIHDPALHLAPIHRLLFGVRGDVRSALSQAFGERLHCTDVATAEAMRQQVRAAHYGDAAPPERQVMGLVGPGARFSLIEITHAPASPAAATVQPFIDDLIARGGASQVDYVHGDAVLEQLARREGCVGFHLPALGKAELLRRVVHEGPLPRKTFSMGEADEKRFYVEARRIGEPGARG